MPLSHAPSLHRTAQDRLKGLFSNLLGELYQETVKPVSHPHQIQLAFVLTLISRQFIAQSANATPSKGIQARQTEELCASATSKLLDLELHAKRSYKRRKPEATASLFSRGMLRLAPRGNRFRVREPTRRWWHVRATYKEARWRSKAGNFKLSCVASASTRLTC